MATGRMVTLEAPHLSVISVIRLLYFRQYIFAIKARLHLLLPHDEVVCVEGSNRGEAGEGFWNGEGGESC